MSNAFPIDHGVVPMLPLEVAMLVPHAAALPYRGDGVARALAQTFDGPVLPLPDDMMVLLNKIDKAEALSAPR